MSTDSAAIATGSCRQPILRQLGWATENSASAKRRALFLDRDGVINVDHGYVCTADRTAFVPGIVDLCRCAQEAEFLIIVITNQAGIARGYYTEAQFAEYTNWLCSQLELEQIYVAATYYCPHHPDYPYDQAEQITACFSRKPGHGMIQAAADEFRVDVASSIFIGDKISDIMAAKNAGIGTSVLVPAGELSASVDVLASLFVSQQTKTPLGRDVAGEFR